MGEIDLPVVDAALPAVAVIDVLKKANVSAVVVTSGRRSTVLRAGDLLSVMRRKGQRNIPVGEIEPDSHTVTLRDLDAEGRALDAADPFPFGPAKRRKAAPSATGSVASAGVGERIDFAVGRIADGKARVLTASERYAEAFRVASTFVVCRGVDAHIWEPRELTVPGVCDLDGEPVDPA